jgi:hypothetical protein
MLTVLVAIRDFLVAVALAWVGVSMETRSGGERSCASDSESCSQRTR